MKLRVPAVACALAFATTVIWAQAPVSTPAAATAPATTAAAESPFKTDKEKVGYAIGLQLGEQIAATLKDVDFDPDTLALAIKDMVTDAKPKMTDEQVIATLTDLKKKMMAKADAEEANVAKNADVNQKAGETFLAENAKKEGVKTTASGLQYKVLKSGSGKSPKATDTVFVHYKGTLINGKKFDESGDKAVSFPLNRVIAGWTEGIQLMKVGDTFQLFIPAKLAYGSNPPPGAPIGPNEVLIFEVELLDVK